MIRINKDPISAYTHFAGFAVGIVGLVVLLVLVAGDAPKTVGMALFGGSLVLLFGTSGTYHFFDLGERGNVVLRRLDHCAIFLFIAGSYYPPLIHSLEGTWRITMMAVIGGIAVAGVAFKLLWITAPRWLTAGMYLAMGWVVVIPGYLVIPALPVAALTWIAVGGISYSVGAVIYATKRPDPVPGVFGFHEIFHLFVLAGAGTHFVGMLALVNHPYPAF